MTPCPADDRSPRAGLFSLRKAFTVSERVAIGAAIEAELQGRQLANLKQNTDPENIPGRESPKGDTRDLVAKATGFGNGKTYEQAKPTQSKPLLQKP